MWIKIGEKKDRLSKQQEYIRSMQDWYSFKGETKEFYNIDMSVLEVMSAFARQCSECRFAIGVDAGALALLLLVPCASSGWAGTLKTNILYTTVVCDNQSTNQSIDRFLQVCFSCAA